MEHERALAARAVCQLLGACRDVGARRPHRRPARRGLAPGGLVAASTFELPRRRLLLRRRPRQGLRLHRPVRHYRRNLPELPGYGVRMQGPVHLPQLRPRGRARPRLAGRLRRREEPDRLVHLAVWRRPGCRADEGGDLPARPNHLRHAVDEALPAIPRGRFRGGARARAAPHPPGVAHRLGRWRRRRRRALGGPQFLGNLLGRGRLVPHPDALAQPRGGARVRLGRALAGRRAGAVHAPRGSADGPGGGGAAWR
mmetsp:Transcript_82642/g.162070  ORF Transcript_82642/g.162070 Transcript_82642/m.162070 type:complete len:255 (-) Transcript_82642:329-1093(-)